MNDAIFKKIKNNLISKQSVCSKKESANVVFLERSLNLLNLAKQIIFYKSRNVSGLIVDVQLIIRTLDISNLIKVYKDPFLTPSIQNSISRYLFSLGMSETQIKESVVSPTAVDQNLFSIMCIDSNINKQ